MCVRFETYMYVTYVYFNIYKYGTFNMTLCLIKRENVRTFVLKFRIYLSCALAVKTCGWKLAVLTTNARNTINNTHICMYGMYI